MNILFTIFLLIIYLAGLIFLFIYLYRKWMNREWSRFSKSEMTQRMRRRGWGFYREMVADTFSLFSLTSALFIGLLPQLLEKAGTKGAEREDFRMPIYMAFSYDHSSSHIHASKKVISDAQDPSDSNMYLVIISDTTVGADTSSYQTLLNNHEFFRQMVDTASEINKLLNDSLQKATPGGKKITVYKKKLRRLPVSLASSLKQFNIDLYIDDTMYIGRGYQAMLVISPLKDSTVKKEMLAKKFANNDGQSIVIDSLHSIPDKTINASLLTPGGDGLFNINPNKAITKAVNFRHSPMLVWEWVVSPLKEGKIDIALHMQDELLMPNQSTRIPHYKTVTITAIPHIGNWIDQLSYWAVKYQVLLYIIGAILLFLFTNFLRKKSRANIY